MTRRGEPLLEVVMQPLVEAVLEGRVSQATTPPALVAKWARQEGEEEKCEKTVWLTQRRRWRY